MKKVISIILVLAMILSFAACANSTGDKEAGSKGVEGEKVLRIATSGDYLGFTVYDEKTQVWSGFEIDMWTEISKRIGYKLELIQEDVATGFGDLDNNRVDTVAKQISITPARKEKYEFTTPYFFSPYSLLVTKDNAEISKWADMSGKTIGLADGSAMNEFVAALDPDNKVNKKTYESFAMIPAEVVMGRVDSMPYAYLLLPYLLEKNTDWELKCVDTENPIYTEVNAYPFARTERGNELRQLVDGAIKDMLKDGTHKQLCMKWFNYDVMETEKAKEYYK
jgi:putative amino-acid transport system substrate-binding protein